MNDSEYQHKLERIFVRFPSVQNTGFGEAYKPGLAHMEEFDTRMGNPSKGFWSIHVAGTNGKGSVANMLASALAATGLKVGLYTSPHILDFRERMRILDGRTEEPVYLISREDVWDFLSCREKAFDELDCIWLSADATLEDNPPIKLKNNWFVRMFEPLTDMYGRPDYNEFDPTPYISVFFLLFFAMCMGDAGYGLLLFIGGLLLNKVDSFKSLAPLVSTLGVGTFVVGIVMHTFFGVDIAALSWIPCWLKSIMITGTIAGFEAQMVLSLVIGVVHLCLAMVVKTVYATRNRGFLGSLGVWGWTLLIVGGVVVGTLAIFKLLPSEVVKWIIIVLGVVSALGIFLFNDIKRNPLKNIGSGLWETYNTVTGLLGDVLSYLRLYALGLAGGMLGKAFNDIAAMTLGDGSFGIGWLAFAVILVIGHALNLAMCCLGAFVHPLRLNFLEFFKNSGYDGKGRTYQPIKK